MKLSLHHAPLGGVLFLALSAMPAHAQWATFDATQNINALRQITNEQKSLVFQTQRIAQGSEANMTLAQQLSTDLKLAATALQTYNTVYNTYTVTLNNLRYFNSKQIWRTAEMALMSRAGRQPVRRDERAAGDDQRADAAERLDGVEADEPRTAGHIVAVLGQSGYRRE